MPVSSPCPSRERLRQLLAETSVDEDQAELVSHLDQCPFCQHTLEELAGGEPVLQNAVTALQLTVHGDEPPLRRVLDEIKSRAQATYPTPPDYHSDWVRSLLQPVDNPAALGRLEGYEVTDVIGRGGMGLVLKAYDPALKRWVAIKVLAPYLAGDPVARQRFAREAQAAAAVRHPHVVAIHAVREVNGLPFIVMEYVGGGSLQDFLDHQRLPDWRTVARLGAEIAEGLAAAHARGQVHRDIKPSNVLLQTEDDSHAPGPVKIADFGLARAADEARLTRTGTVMGTPMYMAPEQALCEPIDERADLFSLGSVLYVLCTGREPFPAGSPMAVLRSVCDAAPTPVRMVNPDVPAWLAAVIERLHAKRPDDRFDSAAAVAELLRYNLRHPDQPRLVPPPSSGRRRSHRRRWAIPVALLAALLLFGAWKLAGSDRKNDGPGVKENGIALRATLMGHTGPIWSVAFAPGGLALASGSDDTTLRLWDVTSKQEKARLSGHGSAVQSVAFAHSGKFLLASSGDGALHQWELPSQKELPPLVTHGGSIGRRMALSADDKTVAIGNGTQGVDLWGLTTRKVWRSLPGNHGSITAVVYAPDGALLATADTGGSIRLWSPDTGSELPGLPGDPLGVRALAFSVDSKQLASAGLSDRGIKLWDVEGRKLASTLDGYNADAFSMAISPDGRLLAVGGADGTVMIWLLNSERPGALLQAHQGTVIALAFSPDSRSLATGGRDRLVRLWDLSALVDKPG